MLLHSAAETATGAAEAAAGDASEKTAIAAMAGRAARLRPRIRLTCLRGGYLIRRLAPPIALPLES
jgi:hypothetical protein